MQDTSKDIPTVLALQQRTLRAAYTASGLAVIAAAISFFLLDAGNMVPFILGGFGILSLVIISIYKNNPERDIWRFSLPWLGVCAIFTLAIFTGGIGSPALVLLTVAVIAAYLQSDTQGNLHLVFGLAGIGALLLPWVRETLVQNQVSGSMGAYFSALCVAMAVILLGVLGKEIIDHTKELQAVRQSIAEELQEKETLIKEIHHRVKNNLQTVSSLLSLQSRSIADKKIQNLIKSSQNRVISMAMVHEMLYMRDDITKIEYKTYINELINYLIKSVKGSDSNVKVLVDVPEMELGIDTAIPLGLLINETMTNALKYGIKNDEKGQIHIAMRQEADQSYILTMGDNGIGFSEKVTFETSKSLGLKLIHNLAKQLKGTITRDTTRKGTNYILKFREIGHDEFNSVA
ncbi:MAG: sensor histidine kinase [Bacteroidia bacterium]|nr:sensor histidine kinase [Bacteroidia bacterium]